MAYVLLLLFTCAAYPLAVLAVAAWRSRQVTRHNPVLLPGERPQILAAAVEASCQMAAEPQWLATFLDMYLGSASAAKKDAWDRCRGDAEYLRALITDDLSRRSDEDLVQRVAGAEVALPKDFDPDERLARRRAARQMFTPLQAGAALVGAGVLVLMFLFPPWVRRADDITWFLFTVQNYRIESQQLLGYRPVGHSGFPPNEFQEIHTGDLGKVRFKRVQYVVSSSLLAGQVALVSGLAVLAVGSLRTHAGVRSSGAAEVAHRKDDASV